MLKNSVYKEKSLISLIIMFIITLLLVCCLSGCGGGSSSSKHCYDYYTRSDGKRIWIKTC